MATDKRGNILHLNIEIECMDSPGALESIVEDARKVRLLIGGICVFEGNVYDTDPSGRRTNEWARQELLLRFATRLKRVLDLYP